MIKSRSYPLAVGVITAMFILQAAVATAQDGGDNTIPSEIRALLKQVEINEKTLAAATLPLQMRTAYAVGGVQDCETVISVSNFSKETIRVEVEFFTGFNFFQRGLARLTLKPGETGELATTQVVPPFVINAVRNSSVVFEGYANIHAKTRDIAAHCHMVCHLKSNPSYQSIKVFRTRDGRPFQKGD